MKNFIEVTFKGDESKILVSVKEIIAVYDYGDYTFIAIGNIRRKKHKVISSGYYVTETIEEIKAKIIDASKAV